MCEGIFGCVIVKQADTASGREVGREREARQKREERGRETKERDAVRMQLKAWPLSVDVRSADSCFSLGTRNKTLP